MKIENKKDSFSPRHTGLAVVVVVIGTSLVVRIGGGGVISGSAGGVTILFASPKKEITHSVTKRLVNILAVTLPYNSLIPLS